MSIPASPNHLGYVSPIKKHSAMTGCKRKAEEETAEVTTKVIAEPVHDDDDDDDATDTEDEEPHHTEKRPKCCECAIENDIKRVQNMVRYQQEMANLDAAKAAGERIRFTRLEYAAKYDTSWVPTALMKSVRALQHVVLEDIVGGVAAKEWLETN